MALIGSSFTELLKLSHDGIILMNTDSMANTQENAGRNRPVAISSTSSLDSFATTGTSTNVDIISYNTASLLEKERSSTVKQEPTHNIPVNGTAHHVNSWMVSSRPSVVPYPLGQSATATQERIMSSHTPLVSSSSTVKQSATKPSSAANNTVAEFLYQLTKMLTDDNREVIEWNNGKIEVHNPHKLATSVLHQYFRHSKFASFQRQLNYFGFRKLAGKGKMAPCSYVNDAATSDLRSLLLIKVCHLTLKQVLSPFSYTFSSC